MQSTGNEMAAYMQSEAEAESQSLGSRSGFAKQTGAWNLKGDVNWRAPVKLQMGADAAITPSTAFGYLFMHRRTNMYSCTGEQTCQSEMAHLPLALGLFLTYVIPRAGT
jgi:hypothetical protein